MMDDGNQQRHNDNVGSETSNIEVPDTDFPLTHNSLTEAEVPGESAALVASTLVSGSSIPMIGDLKHFFLQMGSEEQTLRKTVIDRPPLPEDKDLLEEHLNKGLVQMDLPPERIKTLTSLPVEKKCLMNYLAYLA